MRLEDYIYIGGRANRRPRSQDRGQHGRDIHARGQVPASPQIAADRRVADNEALLREGERFLHDHDHLQRLSDCARGAPPRGPS